MIPRDFVRKFLKVKGWKWLHEVGCDCKLDSIETDHPIKWLYEHVVMGHEPYFDCCHCWNQGIGNVYYTGEVEEWYRWFTFQWSKEKGDWIVADCYQGCEGYEDPCPSYCWN